MKPKQICDKRNKAMRELQQNLTKETISFLQGILKKYPLDWKEIIKQRIIEKLYTRELQEAYYYATAYKNFTTQTTSIVTPIVSNPRFIVNVSPVESNKKFLEFINSDIYTDLKRMDRDFNVDLSDFICIWFLTLLEKVSSNIILLKKVIKEKTITEKKMITWYGSQLAVYEYISDFNGSGRLAQYNIKVFIVTMQAYLKQNNIPISQSDLYKLISYLQGLQESITQDATRKQFYRTMQEHLSCDYDNALMHFLNRKLCLLREMDSSIYNKIKNEANDNGNEYINTNKAKYKNVWLAMDDQGVLNFIGIRDKVNFNKETMETP